MVVEHGFDGRIALENFCEKAAAAAADVDDPPERVVL